MRNIFWLIWKIFFRASVENVWKTHWDNLEDIHVVNYKTFQYELLPRNLIMHIPMFSMFMLALSKYSTLYINIVDFSFRHTLFNYFNVINKNLYNYFCHNYTH